MVALPSPTTAHDREKHEARGWGEVRPGNVEAAVRMAHSILAAAGVQLSPSKVNRLARDFVRTDPPCTFRTYLSRNVAAVRSLPALPARRGAVEWLDPTGETAVHNVLRAGGAA